MSVPGLNLAPSEFTNPSAACRVISPSISEISTLAVAAAICESSLFAPRSVIYSSAAAEPAILRLFFSMPVCMILTGTCLSTSSSTVTLTFGCTRPTSATPDVPTSIETLHVFSPIEAISDKSTSALTVPIAAITEFLGPRIFTSTLCTRLLPSATSPCATSSFSPVYVTLTFLTVCVIVGLTV